MSSTPDWPPEQIPPQPDHAPASHFPTVNPPAGSATPRGRRRAWIWPAAGALGCVVLGGALGFGAAKVEWSVGEAGAAASASASASPSPTVQPINDALYKCGVASDSSFTVGDGGTSLTVRAAGKITGASITDTYCVLRRLQAPDSMISRMGQTRALDGRQTSVWKGYSASWTYHPDSGMNLVVESSDSHS